MAKRNNSHYKVPRQGKLRDHNICQACGITFSPEGHHIIDYLYGGIPALITLSLYITFATSRFIVVI